MSKRIIKIMIVLSTLAMSAVIILSELIQTPSVAMARTTLPGVEKVRTQNTAEDAFTILEIVPDAGMGEIGYYICGAEPWKTEILSYRTKLDREAYLKSLYDPATKEGRLSSIVAETFNAAPLLYQNYEEKYFLTETESSSGSWNYFDYSSDPLVVSLKGQYVLVDGDAISDYTRTVNAEGAETFSYTPGTGSYKWVSSDAETEKSVEVGKVYYKGAFVNQEWFKNYVVDLDSTQYSGFHIKVQTITPEQLENFDVSSADMIYIAGSNKSFLPVGTPDVYYGSDSSDYNDISWSRTVSILENIVHRNLPVIVDYSVISDAVNVTGRNSANMFRLAAILLQNDLASYYRTQIESSTENPIWTDIPEGAFLDEDNHYVNKNIYVFTQGAEEVSGLVSSNFITPFTNDQINGGFSAVLSELQNENSYLKTIGSTEKISEDVTQAAVVKYIINYANRRGAILKSSVRVLEIEPCEAYFLTKDKIRALTKKTSAELEDDQIELVQMTTAEFIGMKEDLNSRYDMIYIGLETGLMNLVKEGASCII